MASFTRVDQNRPEQAKCLRESHFIQRLVIVGFHFSSSLFSVTFPLWPPILGGRPCPQMPCTLHFNPSSAHTWILFFFLGRSTLFWALSLCRLLGFIYINLTMRIVFFCLFYRWGKWDSRKLGDLPKFTHLLRDAAGAKPPFLKPVSWPLHFSHLVWIPFGTKILLLVPNEILM